LQFKLKEYQDTAVRLVLKRLEDAKDDYRSKDRRVAFALSAITGAGKTVMAAAVFEALFDGSEDLEFAGDSSAVVLWVTDDPNLNAQTRYRIMEASDRLNASRLRIIEEDFNAEMLDPGNVYFLNRQKLTGKTFITRGNKRTVTLWETIGNTINDDTRTLYLVLDEAHRGMRAANGAKTLDEQERSTTVLRLINGYAGTPAAPIVWGISATVERFTQAMKEAADRTTLPNVVVDNSEVQASGLLKDTIALDLPDESGSFTTVLAREAARATRDISALWEEYSAREALPEPVRPLLVVQVPNKPSANELIGILDAIFDEWAELSPTAVANVFGEHTDENYGSYHVPYIAPQDVQDATHVRVLLAKDAISTGWDCPRAETLLSLRPATDRTHITQLLGRLVRTPLARRIDSDERLSAVTCFLPRFDLSTATQVAEVMTGVKDEPDGQPPPRTGRVLIEPVTLVWNDSLPAEVRGCFAALPSKAAPKKPAKPTKRLLNLAAEIALDELLPHPSRDAYQKLHAALDGQLAQRRPEVDANVEAILAADIRRITANRLSHESTETTRQLPSDEKTVDDAFKTATRGFGLAIANGYVKRLATGNAHKAKGAVDVYEAKATVAALAMVPGVVDQLESAAEQISRGWFSSLHASIKNLGEDRKAAYDEIKVEARDPQEVDIVVPTSRIEMTYEVRGDTRVLLPTRSKHCLSDQDGECPIGRLLSWEVTVLGTEMGRPNAIAWYRNPSSATRDGVQVPWCDGERWRSMQPDFIFFFQKADREIAPAIVDPHGHHLNDALGKLKGLADFAEEFGDRFVRVEAITTNDKGDLGTASKGGLLMLDLTRPDIRRVIHGAKSAAAAYRKSGIPYV
jgi:type III restriction enzyme